MVRNKPNSPMDACGQRLWSEDKRLMCICKLKKGHEGQHRGPKLDGDA